MALLSNRVFFLFSLLIQFFSDRVIHDGEFPESILERQECQDEGGKPIRMLISGTSVSLRQ